MNTPYYIYRRLKGTLLVTGVGVLAATAIASCSSNEEYTAGPEPKVGGMSVYFAGDFKQMYISTDKTSSDTIYLVREYTDGDSQKYRASELTVPLKITASDTLLHMSETVTFEAGKDTAILAFSAPNLEINQDVTFSISIPEEYADPYKQRNGSTRLESSVLRGDWEVLADTILFYSGTTIPTMGCKLENLGRKNRFRFTNFMNTGNPLVFSIKTTENFNSKDLTQNYGEIIPLEDYEYNGDYWYFKNNNWSRFNFKTPWDNNFTDEQGAAWEADPFTVNYIKFYCAADGYNTIDLRLSKNATNITLDGKKFKNDYTNHYGVMCAWIIYANQDAGYQYFYTSIGYEAK